MSSALGNIVRTERKKLGLTQQELADLSGTSMLFISQLEREKRTVRLDKVLSVLGVLGLEVCIRRGREGIRGDL